MFLRALKGIVYAAVILLLGQIEVSGTAVGAHFSGLVMRAVEFSREELTRVPAFQKLGGVGPASIEGVQKETIE